MRDTVRVVQQYLSETTITQSNGGPAYYSGAALGILSPSVSLLDQFSTFQGLYDQYKILRIDWEFRPFFAASAFVPSNLDQPPLI